MSRHRLTIAQARRDERNAIAGTLDTLARRMRTRAPVAIAGAEIDPNFAAHHAALLETVATMIRGGFPVGGDYGG